MQWICGRSYEVKLFVVTTRSVVFGMDGQRANSCEIGCLQGAQDRILHQRTADSSLLPFAVNRQPGKQHDRNRMPRQPFLYPLRRIRVFHLPDCKAVIADNHAIDNANICLG